MWQLPEWGAPVEGWSFALPAVTQAVDGSDRIGDAVVVRRAMNRLGYIQIVPGAETVERGRWVAYSPERNLFVWTGCRPAPGVS